MFSPDVVSIRQFYATRFGVAARGLIAAAIAELWPELNGDVTLGIGYALPYMEAYVNQPGTLMVCMPAQQGAVSWPQGRGNVVFIAQESELPMPHNSVNRVLLIHSIEHSEQLAGMMDDIWRVLTPGGRVLAVVPNRMGFWARASRSPLGYGRPFSMLQLRDMLTDHQFTLTRSSSALFIPPTRIRLLWRLAHYIELIGKILVPFLGGVLLVEGEKQLYASIKQPVTARRSYRLPIPVVKPAMSSRIKL